MTEANFDFKVGCNKVTSWKTCVWG